MKAPRLHLIWSAILSTLCVFAPQGQAQTYPSKPVRMIIPSSAGSGFDVIGRIVALGIAENLGQQVIVDNRAGASTNIGAELAAKAPADGYTLLIGATSHTANVTIFRNLQYDFVRDFAPITLLASAPSVVVVHPSLPVKSIAEFVKLAKARPGQIIYGSPGIGSSSSIAAEMFKNRAGITMLHVPYRGGGEAVIAVVSGEVSVYTPPVASVIPHIKSGKLRLLAATGAQRIATLPDTPTIAESGYPGFDASAWNGILVPAKTPKDVIARILGATLSTLKDPTVNKRLLELGYVVVGNQPDEFAAFIKAEIEALRVILADLRGTME
jgi:tripartite-type tricarboxylate transporter receptor subunit TctC